MKEKITKYVITPVLVGSMVVTGYSTVKMKYVQHQNEKLKRELETKVEAPPIVYNVTVEDIEEMNRKNVDLIVFESAFSSYSMDIADNNLFGINSHIKANFRYFVTIDMSRSKISTSNDMILVHVDLDDIKLKEVVITQPQMGYETNMITRLRGKKIIELEAQMLTKMYEGIDKEVQKDFKANKETFKLNLVNKLNKLYDSDHVKVIFE
jgi:hypothetical protein